MEPWYGDEEKDAMVKYMESGGWLTEYKETRFFEQQVSNYLQIKHANAVNNGTLALFGSLLALGLGAGDEVIVPDYTMISSTNVIGLVNASPVILDIDPLNLCLDINLLEDAITPNTKAVLFVSINGRSPNMDKLVSICKKNGLFLIEDSAQSLGSKYKAKHLGTFGDVGTFSFSTPKIITTGQGGMVVTDNDVLDTRIKLVKNFGRTESARSTGKEEVYESVGLNFKFTDLQAVIGIEQMKKLDWRVERKKEMYKLYHETLKNIPEIKFIKTDLVDTTPWFIDILVAEREKLASYLNEHKVGTLPFHPPIHTQKPYEHIRGDFIESLSLSKQGLWLPSSTFLSDEDILYVCSKISEFYK